MQSLLQVHQNNTLHFLCHKTWRLRSNQVLISSHFTVTDDDYEVYLMKGMNVYKMKYVFCRGSLVLEAANTNILIAQPLKCKHPKKQDTQDNTVRKYMHSLLIDANKWGTQKIIQIDNVLVVRSDHVLFFFFLFNIINVSHEQKPACRWLNSCLSGLY